MYYQNYEDYMRSMLGYPIENQDTYQTSRNQYLGDMQMQDIRELEELYPDIFKTLNPAIEDVCSRCNNPITRDTLEDMVEDVYSKIERNEIAVNINIINDSEITSNLVERPEADNKAANQNLANTNISRVGYNRNNVQNVTLEQNKRIIENKEDREVRQRRPTNSLLRDLIKILILNRLIGNRPGRPNIMPPRPPFYGEPRPPVMPPRNSRPGNNNGWNYDGYLRF